MKLVCNKQKTVDEVCNYYLLGETEKLILQLIVYLITKMNITPKLFKEMHNGHFSPNERVKFANLHSFG